MNARNAFILWTFLLVSFGLCERTVIELLPSNFKETIAKPGLTLVSFYAPWCGHCKVLGEALKKVAASLDQQEIDVLIAQIDGSAESASVLADEEQVTGFPTLLLYSEGQRIAEYTGPRKADHIIEYLKRKSNPPVRVIESLDELAPFLTSLEDSRYLDHGVLGLALAVFLPGVEPSHAMQTYTSFASGYDEALFFMTQSATIAREFHVQSEALVVYNGDRKDVYHLVSLSPNVTEEDLLRSLLAFSLPSSLPYTSETTALIDAIPVPTHAIAFYDGSGSDEVFLDSVVAAASDYRGRVLVIESSSEEYALMNHFEIRDSDLPQLFLVNRAEDPPLRYSFAEYLAQLPPGSLPDSSGSTQPLQRHPSVKRIVEVEDEEEVFQFNSTHIQQFFNSYLINELPRALSSEKISVIAELNRKNPIPQIVNIAGSQFNELVIDADDDNTLVFFHAPWCIHCKMTETMLAELVEDLPMLPPLKIFRIDGSRNEVFHPKIRVRGFPMVFLFPAHDKANPLYYDGERSAEALSAFIREHCLLSDDHLEESEDNIVEAQVDGENRVA
eukprot:scaffold1348_cov184-Ochromonas_danica.AAC.3